MSLGRNVLTAPPPSNTTQGQYAGISLLTQLFIASHIPDFELVTGSELSLSGSSGQSSFVSIFKSLLEQADQTTEALGAPATTSRGKASSDGSGAVEKWIDASTNYTLAGNSSDAAYGFPVQDLNNHLANKTYIAHSQCTAADVAVFARLQSYFSQASRETLLSHPNVTRHFDLLQHTPSVITALSKLPPNTLSSTPISIDLDNVPVIERKPEPKKEKKDKKAVSGDAAPVKSEGKDTAAGKEAKAKKGETAAAAAAPSDANNGVDKKEKKEKVKKEDGGEKGAAQSGAKPAKEKKSGGASGGAPAGAAAAEPEKISPGLIDLRVGKIIDVKKHPDADSLYVEQIDVGEAEARTVVSGLVNYIPIEEMQGKVLICVCNLKPAAMRGIKSYAMVLAATSRDGKSGMGSVELVAPPEGSAPGDRVYFEGFEQVSPLEQLPPKKKVFETIQPGFTTLDTREAAWVDSNNDGKVHRIVTKNGSCKAPTHIGASLS